MKLPDSFLRNVREAQDQALSASSCVPEVRARMPVRAPTPRRKIRRSRVVIACSALLLVGVLAAGLVGVVGKRLGMREHDLTFWVGPESDAGQVGAFIAADDAELPLRFSDGTLLALEQGARARVAGVDPVGAHIILERGVARASVVHTEKSHWRLDVGPFDVSVIGTRFDVSWNPNDEVLVLNLYEGAVVVGGSFLGEPRVVGKGQTLHAFCKQRRAEILEAPRADASRAPLVVAGALATAALSVDPTGVPTSGVPSMPAIGARPADPLLPSQPPFSDVSDPASERARGGDAHAHRLPIAVTAESSSWQKLAGAGKLREAWKLLEQEGFDAECNRASGSDLVQLGDVARLVGDPARAERAYLSARGKLSGGGRSAYGLGLLAFDQRKDFADAGRWFETYLREQPQGALRREAEGRLIEAWQRAGDLRRARSTAEKYLVDFPDGAHAALARQVLGR